MLLISDVHFGINRESEVNRILTAADPECSGGCVVIAGDLVQSATKGEYKDAGEFVQKLIDLGNVVCVTPGNHDFQISGAPDGSGSDKVNFIPTRWDNARKYYREYILKPVLAQESVVARGSEAEEATRYDMLARHGNDLFLCLRSTHRRSFKSTFLGFRSIGRIREKQIDWAREALQEAVADVESPRIHIVSHRSLWQTHDDKHPPLSRANRV
jgi:3',5'-cyclic AMP phosphodiesterase CpdA